MSDINRNTNNLYNKLKQRSIEDVQSQTALQAGYEMEEIALDDTQRTKVLSPARLIAKRFFRNKLAIVGLTLLVFMFSFAFIGPLFYPYSQTQVFYKYDWLVIDYASAVERTEYLLYKLPGSPDIQSTVVNRFNSYIIDMISQESDELSVTATDGNEFIIKKLGEDVYLFAINIEDIAGTYFEAGELARVASRVGNYTWSGTALSDELKEAVIRALESDAETVTHNDIQYTISRNRNQFIISLQEPALELTAQSPGNDFITAVESNLGNETFEYGGTIYSINNTETGIYEITMRGDTIDAYVASRYVFNTVDTGMVLSDELRRNALLALYDNGEFTADGDSYLISNVNDDIYIKDSSGDIIAELSVFAVRRFSGQDTLPMDFKHTVQEVIEEMQEAGITETQFTYGLHAISENGEFLYEENGDPVYEDTEITITRKNTGNYDLTCERITYLIDIFAPPNPQNIFGTDGDGMDLLARFMYGGRISLMVGFVVVFLEIIIGVILGGISGFFSGPIDTLIMRIVDVFYCIPGLAIMIIFGAMFDRMKMSPYIRLMWMMVILGVLGWAGIARLVRGQILSLREQEFMTAQEATGMKTRKRIFRHLIPNVMPLLIVNATMGIGGVIIYESTLSFLGLGVKHPLATWGTIINSVTNNSDSMGRYAYIWIPAGMLISLTVIAFNFVGDGLRDAFDPKMKT